jgi:hypothetical protein
MFSQNRMPNSAFRNRASFPRSELQSYQIKPNQTESTVGERRFSIGLPLVPSKGYLFSAIRLSTSDIRPWSSACLELGASLELGAFNLWCGSCSSATTSSLSQPLRRGVYGRKSETRNNRKYELVNPKS